jgi:polar amino acid transport system permease protein
MNAFVADLPSLGRGLLTTFGISALSMLLAVAFGFVAGVLRSIAPRALDLPLLAVIEFFRGLPLLVLMYFLFFGLPQLGIHTSGNVAAIAALSLYAGALGSEIVRGAIVSIPLGQTEAARALGIGNLATLRLVVIPQALARMLPPFVALFATIVESSSLAALIGVEDLLQSVRAHVEADSDLKLPLYSTALVAYFAINYPVSLASRRLGRKVGTA